MHISKLLLTTMLISVMSGITLSAQAADAIIVTSIAQIEIESIDKNGKKTVKLSPVDKAVPGSEVIFTTTFENTLSEAVSDITINNPIPAGTTYKSGSSFGKDSEILFSVDGKFFGFAEDVKIKDEDGKERIALAKEYTHIRWNYKVPLAAGKSSKVGFRAIIK